MLAWLFFGVAIISDAFVEAIEVITSTKHIVKRKNELGEVVYNEEPVWNWVVANITLLAVGSSSPEILLSIVEACITLGETPGEIGPACIIGSGSYNLFGILAICTAALPDGVMKMIEHQKVFIWTTTWSLVAHLWIWLAYKKITPGIIDIWEAFLTLGMFPVLVYTAWLVDTRGWHWYRANKNAVVPSTLETTLANGKEELDALEAGDDVVAISTPSLKGTGSMAGSRTFSGRTASGMAKLGPNGEQNRPSILYYRHLAMNKLAGGGGSRACDTPPSLWAGGDHAKQFESEIVTIDMAKVDAMGKHLPKVMIKSTGISVLESVGEARIQVLRIHGDLLHQTVLVSYRTQDDTAIAGLDYEATEGTLVFGPGEESKEIAVMIIDDDMSEPDVVFQVILHYAEVEGGGDVKILRRSVDVTIVDDDDSGILSFELPTYDAGAADPHAEVAVRRRSGADGKVSIDYFTKDGTAFSGTHFKSAKGTLVFEPRETVQIIQIPILPFQSQGHLAFRLMLDNPLGGVVLGTRRECRVLLVPGQRLKKTPAHGGSGGDELGGYDLWGEWEGRFKEAVKPTFDEDAKGAELWISMCAHYVSITFKLLAACLPPPEWYSGYPGLIAALLMLGALMGVVKCAARMLGCATGLSDMMTGLTIVAFGTSLPDTFASVYAALNSDYADEAIGNVMGSNCVNVFLGLGIPWVICSLFYASHGDVYHVIAGSLGFSIMVFNVLALVVIAMIVFMRGKGGELGSPNRLVKWLLFWFYMSLWFIFLILSGILDYKHFPDPGF